MSSLFNDFNQPTNNMANLLSQFNQFAQTANQLRQLLK